MSMDDKAKKYKGKFIVFEGIDGCGKSTQAQLLCDGLNGLGRETVLTDEPYRNKTLKTRKDVAPIERQRLFIEDRLSHLRDFVIPNMEKGINVISDRYCFSTLAYGISEGISGEELMDLHLDILGEDFVIPDLTIFIDLEVEEAVKRLNCRNDECGYFDREEKLRPIRKAYLDIYGDERLRQKFNIKLVSSNRPIEEVSRDILAETMKIFF